MAAQDPIPTAPPASAGSRRVRTVVKTLAISALGVPLIAGVAWAGAGDLESWGSALIGFLFLIAIMMTSGNNGFWIGED